MLIAILSAIHSAHRMLPEADPRAVRARAQWLAVEGDWAAETVARTMADLHTALGAVLAAAAAAATAAGDGGS